MIAAGMEPEGLDVRPPDFEHIARAYGYAHRRVTSRGALEAALNEFGRRRQIVILEIPAEEFLTSG